MSHEPYIVDGQRWPSVTEIAGVIDKSKWLNPWASKHGTLKAKALLSVLSPTILQQTPEVNPYPEEIVKLIPDDFFTKNRLSRDEFWMSCEEIKDEAAAKGTGFHARLHSALSGVEGEFGDEVQAVERWAKLNEMKPGALFEQKVINKFDCYHGTYDCFAQLADGYYIIDWKRSKQIDKSYFVQLGGYSRALHREEDWSLMVVRVKEGVFAAKEDDTKVVAPNHYRYKFKGLKTRIETKETDDIAKYEGLFMKCLEIWRYMNDWKTKLN